MTSPSSNPHSSNKSPTLSSRINTYTKQAHARDRAISSFKLLLCLIDPILYARLVRQFYELYQTVEGEVRRHIENKTAVGRVLENVVLEEVYRERAFEKDLRYWCGPDWREWDITGQMKRYKEHILKISEEDPIRLLAYLYTMGFGLFAGGQVVKRKLVRHLLPSKTADGDGLAIFTFNSPVFQLKREYHERFDTLELDGDAVQRILDESRLIFSRNFMVISDIQGLPGALYRILIVKFWWIWVVVIALWYYARMSSVRASV